MAVIVSLKRYISFETIRRQDRFRGWLGSGGGRLSAMRHFLGAAAVAASAVVIAAQPAPLDIGIVNARLINGLGFISGAGYVGIRGDRIEMVDETSARQAKFVIDAKGQV